MLDYLNFPIPRRFVRIKAIHYLYAFHINKQASYQYGLEEVKTAFIPDVFAKESVDTTQLEKEKIEALSLFATWDIGKTSYIAHAADNTVAYEVASKLWEEYQARLAKETNKLKKGFQSTLDKILDVYLLILQLVVEWFIIAQDQAQKSKEVSANITYPAELVGNAILKTLHTDDSFLSIMLQRNLSWNQHMGVVGRWYNQFIKDSVLFHNTSPTTKADRDSKLLPTILHQIVLVEEDIQHFFSALDLGWEEDGTIIKKLLNHLDVKNLLTTIKDLTQLGAISGTFYTKLVESALEQDRKIEALIQQNIQNWSIERIVLLDRIIIKLALCEMCYLPDTPIKVIINEYVDIAKEYSTPKSGAFANGVLDTVAKKI